MRGLNIGSLFGGGKKDSEEELSLAVVEVDDGLNVEQRAIVRTFCGAFSRFFKVQGDNAFRPSFKAFAFEINVHLDWPKVKVNTKINIASLAEFTKKHERSYGIREALFTPSGFTFILDPSQIAVETEDNEKMTVEPVISLKRANTLPNRGVKRESGENVPVEAPDDYYNEEQRRPVKKYRTKMPTVTASAQKILDGVEEPSRFGIDFF